MTILSYWFIGSEAGKVSGESAALFEQVDAHHDQTESCFIAMVKYSDLIYEDIELSKDVTGQTGRTFMLDVTRRLKDGLVYRCYALVLDRTGC